MRICCRGVKRLGSQDHGSATEEILAVFASGEGLPPPPLERIANNHPAVTFRAALIVAAVVDDPERESRIINDLALSVSQVVNEHVIFPVQGESEVDPVCRFLDVREGEGPFSEIPLIGDADEIVLVPVDFTGTGAEIEDIFSTSEEAAVFISSAGT